MVLPAAAPLYGRQPTVDDEQGQRRITIEIDAEHVAVSLTYATAQATKTFRTAQTTQTPARFTAAPRQARTAFLRPLPAAFRHRPNRSASRR
jgi:single-strand DNA-binding protein